MVLIICTKNESNLTNRYWDMVTDGRTEWTDGRMHGRRQNYIPPTSSGDNYSMQSLYIKNKSFLCVSSLRFGKFSTQILSSEP